MSDSATATAKEIDSPVPRHLAVASVYWVVLDFTLWLKWTVLLAIVIQLLFLKVFLESG